MSEQQPYIQQIDFYLDEFKPQREPLMAHHLVMALAGFMVFLTVFSISKRVELTQFIEQEQTLAQENSSLVEQIESLREQIPESRQQELDAQMNGLKMQLYRRQQLRQLIEQMNLGNAQGFSEQMDAMARQYLPQLSLSAFSLSQGGGYFEMTGVSNQATQVPVYLEKLKSEPSFQRTRFGVVQVERSEKEAGTMNFSVTSPERQSEIDSDAEPKLQASALSQLQAVNEGRN